MWEDPIVDEIREHRLEHAKEFDFNLDKIFADLKKKQDESKRDIVSFNNGKCIVLNKSDDFTTV